MKNVRLVISCILFVASLLTFSVVSFHHYGTSLYYFFVILYGLSLGFFGHEVGKKLKKKTKIKQIKKQAVFGFFMGTIVIAVLVFLMESWFNLSKNIKIWSMIFVFLLGGIMMIVFIIRNKNALKDL